MSTTGWLCLGFCGLVAAAAVWPFILWLGDYLRHGQKGPGA